MDFFSLNIHNLQQSLNGRKAGLAENPKSARKAKKGLVFPEKAEDLTTAHIRELHSGLRTFFKSISPNVKAEQDCCGSTWGHEDFAENVQKQLSHWSHPNRTVSERARGFEAEIKASFPTPTRSFLERMIKEITNVQNSPDITPANQEFLKSDKAVIQRLLNECV